MRVKPIEAMTYFSNSLRDQEDNSEPKSKSKRGVEDINPSFKYYMDTCQPIKPQVIFTGHGPYHFSSSTFDPNGFLFPIPYRPMPPRGPFTGRLDRLA